MPGLTNNTDTLSALNQIIVALNELTEATRSCCAPSYSPVRPSYLPGGSPGPDESFPPGTDEEVAARRCKAAIFLVDQVLYNFADWGNRLNLDDYYNYKLIIDPTIKGAILGFTVGFLLPPGDIGGGGFGALIGGIIGNAFANVSIASSVIELGSIVEFASQNRDTLICALATTTNGLAAQIAFRRIVNNSGLSLGNKTFVNGLIDTNAIALLFFVNENYLVFEQLLESITDPCPCQDIAPATPTTLTDEYKCKAANYIFDGFKGTAANLGTLTSFAYMSIPTLITSLIEGLLSTLMVGIFANVVGLAGILSAVVSGLSTLAWRGFNFFNVFSAVAASLQADKTDIVCELYNAANTADPIATARAALEARIDTYVDAAVANTEFAAEADTFKSVLKLLLSNVVLNALAEINEDADDYNVEGMVDCTGCEPCHTVNVLVGEVSGTWPTFTFTSGTEQGCPWLQFKVNWDEQTDQACGPMAKIVSYSGAPAGGGLICGGARRFYAEDDSSTVYSGQNSSMDTVSNICLRYWSIVAEAPFTLTITFEDC